MTPEIRAALKDAVSDRRRATITPRCEECEQPLTPQRVRYRARFCGNPCRQRWWRRNTEAGQRWLQRHGNRSRRQRAAA